MIGTDYDWYLATKDRRCHVCTIKKLEREGKEIDEVGKEFDEVLAKFK